MEDEATPQPADLFLTLTARGCMETSSIGCFTSLK